MKEFCQPKKSILKGIGRFCAILGIDISQYRVLLRLFSMLSDRMEFMGMTAGLKKVIGVYVFISLIISLMAFRNPPLPSYLLFMIAYSMFFLFMILLIDAGNSIMNPDEASVLSHQPIRGATYVAAKMSYMLVIVAVFVPALNLLPAITGLYLRNSRWFYPLTHMITAYLAGLFVAFFVCGIYGWLFRYVSPAKMKNAALWMQLIAVIGMSSSSALVNLLGESSSHRAFAFLLHKSWMPWHWFVAIGLAGHAEYPDFSAWEAWAACLVTFAFILFGLRSFRADYMATVSSLLQGSAGSASRVSRRSWLSLPVRKGTGAQSGYGAFAFTSIMMRRDWNFRRQAVLLLLYFPMLLVVLINGIRHSPFVHGGFSIQDFSPLHAFPHALGLMVALACSLISYTAEPKGSEVFVSLPIGNLRSFSRGIYLSVWFPVAVLHVCLLVPCTWFWGIREGVLFIFFSLALFSFYLGLAVFLIEGFPFANVFKPSQGNAILIILLIGVVPIFIFAAVQWVVFHNSILVLAAAIILSALAYAAARLSLGKLESRIRENLKLLGFGPQHLFKELE